MGFFIVVVVLIVFVTYLLDVEEGLLLNWKPCVEV